MLLVMSFVPVVVIMLWMAFPDMAVGRCRTLLGRPF